MSFAIDVNILLYASDSGSSLNGPARTFLIGCADNKDLFYIGWPTLMSYLRMATHPSIFRYPLPQAEAESNVAALLKLPHLRMLSEGDGFWEIYQELAGTLPVQGNLVPDAHLAAILIQNGVRTIYTRDRDFRKFDLIQCIDPFK